MRDSAPSEINRCRFTFMLPGEHRRTGFSRKLSDSP
jgi:hypothetical protein